MSPLTINKIPHHVFLAHKDFSTELLDELSAVVQQLDRLVIAKPQPSIWAQDVWRDVVEIKFESISQAIQALRALGKNWIFFPHKFYRRANLIQEGLQTVAVNRIPFPNLKPIQPFGCWTLHDANTILASTNTQKNAPLGAYEFCENKQFPPNRAYLKLWETFSCLDFVPEKNALCLDLGASPGGWTWVLQSLGCRVIAVDKAELDPKIGRLANVTAVKQSAFALDARHHEPVNWLFSDVICYPQKLYTFVSRWIEFKKCQNFVCTLKLQGKTDNAMLKKFLDIPNSQILHLYHNKHEVTWVRRVAQ